MTSFLLGEYYKKSFSNIQTINKKRIHKGKQKWRVLFFHIENNVWLVQEEIFFQKVFQEKVQTGQCKLICADHA